jgi:hypothetical protein
MIRYLLFGLSLAAAVTFLAAGLAMNIPPAATDAAAQSCCWAPQGKDTRCYPCRPTRDTR